MYGAQLIAEACSLHAAETPVGKIAAALGVGRTTVERWVSRDTAALIAARSVDLRADCEDRCRAIGAAPHVPYAYLLGVYLGDGHISTMRNGVHRLSIYCCTDPTLMDECADAMAAVLPSAKVGRATKTGCVAVNSYSRHWPCLFPQHGLGRKHERAIVLKAWQNDIAAAHPDMVVRGLIHSDGSRCVNRVRSPKGAYYEYPRYFFSNRSTDIIGIFTDACDRLGIDWRMNLKWSVSIARRDAVVRMDEIVGPKR